MEIKQEKMEDAVVLRVAGRLDAATSPELEQAFSSLDGQRLVLDLSELDYISSAGLRVLLARLKRIQPAGGQMLLAGLKPEVREVFEITGFTALFPMFDTLPEALSSLED